MNEHGEIFVIIYYIEFMKSFKYYNQSFEIYYILVENIRLKMFIHMALLYLLKDLK